MKQHPTPKAFRFEIGLYPMTCYPDGSSTLYNPSDRDAPQVDAPEFFDVVLKMLDENYDLIDTVIEFDELNWDEAQSALALLSKQYPDAALDDLTQQCRSHWSPPEPEQKFAYSFATHNDNGVVVSLLNTREEANGFALQWLGFAWEDSDLSMEMPKSHEEASAVLREQTKWADQYSVTEHKL